MIYEQLVEEEGGKKLTPRDCYGVLYWNKWNSQPGVVSKLGGDGVRDFYAEEDRAHHEDYKIS